MHERPGQCKLGLSHLRVIGPQPWELRIRQRTLEIYQPVLPTRKYTRRTRVLKRMKYRFNFSSIINGSINIKRRMCKNFIRGQFGNAVSCSRVVWLNNSGPFYGELRIEKPLWKCDHLTRMFQCLCPRALLMARNRPFKHKPPSLHPTYNPSSKFVNASVINREPLFR